MGASGFVSTSNYLLVVNYAPKTSYLRRTKAWTSVSGVMSQHLAILHGSLGSLDLNSNDRFFDQFGRRSYFARNIFPRVNPETESDAISRERWPFRRAISDNDVSFDLVAIETIQSRLVSSECLMFSPKVRNINEGENKRKSKFKR